MTAQVPPESQKDQSYLLWIAGAMIVAMMIVAVFLIVLLRNRATGDEIVDNSWSYVQARGVLRVGTAADYPPFSFYNDQNQIDGFDPALIRALGNRLGVKVEVLDFAFEGLGAALQAGQVDVLAAAISVTPARQEKADFSNIYYVGQDGLLAQQSANLSPITNPDQLSGLRIGVQRRSIYEAWLRETLVDTGKLNESSLFTYAQPAHAVNDLRLNRLDVVMMDLQPATAALAGGGLVLVGQGLDQQRYAFAVQAGAGELQAQLNRGLLDLQNDGTVTRLVVQHLGLRPEDILPPPTPEPTEEPCSNTMQLVQDLTHDDQNLTNLPRLQPGEGFQKGWRVRNTGTCTWDSSYSLRFVRGNNDEARMQGQTTAINGTIAPNQTSDLFVNLIAPTTSGQYIGYWQMHVNDVPFGPTLRVAIEVPAEQRTATPSPTPQDTVTPTLVPPSATALPPTAPPTATVLPPTETPIPSNTPEPLPTERPGQELIGLTWSLQEYLPVDAPDNRNLTPILPDTLVELFLDENNLINGSLGCNTFNGRYVTDGEQMLFSGFALTQLLCEEPQGVMDQEARLLVLLQSTTEYRFEMNVSGAQLTLIRIEESDNQREEVVLMVYRGSPTPR